MQPFSIELASAPTLHSSYAFRLRVPALSVPLQLFVETLSGKVVRVIDGDTFEILDQHRTVHRIRLAGIDALETGQDFRTKAKRRLIDLAAGRRVHIEFNMRDRYKRNIGKIIADNMDVNMEMVRAGLASSMWPWRRFDGVRIQTQRLVNADTGEVELYCHSTQRQKKEVGMHRLVGKRLEAKRLLFNKAILNFDAKLGRADATSIHAPECTAAKQMGARFSTPPSGGGGGDRARATRPLSRRRRPSHLLEQSTAEGIVGRFY